MSDAEPSDLTIADELDIWLAMQPKPRSPVVWQEVGWKTLATGSRRRLAIQIGRLDECFDTGFAERRHARLFARVRWLPDGFEVDVNGGADPERATARLCRGDAGGATLADAGEAARVTWAWLAGKVPDGYVLVPRR